LLDDSNSIQFNSASFLMKRRNHLGSSMWQKFRKVHRRTRAHEATKKEKKKKRKEKERKRKNDKRKTKTEKTLTQSKFT